MKLLLRYITLVGLCLVVICPAGADDVLSIDDIFDEPIRAEDILMPAPTPTPVSPPMEGDIIIFSEPDGSKTVSAITPTSGTHETGLAFSDSDTTDEDDMLIVVKKNISPGDTIQGRYNNALKLAEAGNLESAKLELRQLAHLYSMSKEAPLALYRAALFEQETASLIRSLNELITKYPESSYARLAELKIADICFEAGNYLKAQEYLLQYGRKITEGEEAIEARIKLSYCLMRQKEYEKALILLRSLLLRDKNAQQHAGVYDAMAECLMETGNVEKARNILVLVDKNFPDYRHALRVKLNLGLVQELLGDTEKATAIYEYIRAEYPETPQSNVATERLKDLRTPLLQSPTPPPPFVRRPQ